jgi:4a-hydroxytetrahydrobiopterin dehydratase
MADLAKEHCEDGAQALSEDDAAKLSGEVSGWDRDGTAKLTREFEFGNFRDAFGFVARVALVAEREFHHPDIELGWGRAAFTLTTHSAGGLTRNDFVMAAKIDALEAK